VLLVLVLRALMEYKEPQVLKVSRELLVLAKRVLRVLMVSKEPQVLMENKVLLV